MSQHALLALVILAGACLIIAALFGTKRGKPAQDSITHLWGTRRRSKQSIPWYRARGRSGTIALVLLGMLVLLLLLLLMNLGALLGGQAAPSAAFVVRIAP